jgi:hypothetical protein
MPRLRSALLSNVGIDWETVHKVSGHPVAHVFCVSERRIQVGVNNAVLPAGSMFWPGSVPVVGSRLQRPVG